MANRIPDAIEDHHAVSIRHSAAGRQEKGTVSAHVRIVPTCERNMTIVMFLHPGRGYCDRQEGVGS